MTKRKTARSIHKKLDSLECLLHEAIGAREMGIKDLQQIFLGLRSMLNEKDRLLHIAQDKEFVARLALAKALPGTGFLRIKE